MFVLEKVKVHWFRGENRVHETYFSFKIHAWHLDMHIILNIQVENYFLYDVNLSLILSLF
jgi:hypothetical protein